MKREIPQKVDNLPVVNPGVNQAVFQQRSALFRRTRSSAFLGLALTAGTMSALMPHTKASAFSIQSSGLATVPTSVSGSSSDTIATATPEPIESSALQAAPELSPQNISGFSAMPDLHDHSNVDANELSKNNLLQSGTQLAAVQVQAGQAIPAGMGEVSVNSATTQSSEIDLARSIVIEPGQNPLRESELLVHQVTAGENLTHIAQQYRVSPVALIQANHISNPDVIQVDEKLVIPATTTASLPVVPTVATFPATPLHGTSLAAQALQDSQFLTQAAASPNATSLNASAGAPTVITPRDRESAARTQSLARTGTPSQPLAARRVATMLDIQPVGLKDSSTAENFEAVSAKTSGRKLALFTAQPSQASSSRNSLSRFGGGANTVIARRSFLPQIPIPTLELPALSTPDTFLPSSMGQGNQKYIWPANGALTSGYGWRWGRMHSGIDVAAPIGTPVVAAASGVVLSAGWNEGGYGYLVEIQHPDGSITRYAHNDRILVRAGQMVQQGQRISDMGSTGRSTGPHLHFEIRPSGKGAVNPMFFLARR